MEEKAIAVAVSGAILPNNVLQSLVVGAYTGVEVSEYDQLSRLRDGGCEGVKILVEFVLDVIRVGGSKNGDGGFSIVTVAVKVNLVSTS